MTDRQCRSPKNTQPAVAALGAATQTKVFMDRRD
jgi:hypothetical protein